MNQRERTTIIKDVYSIMRSACRRNSRFKRDRAFPLLVVQMGVEQTGLTRRQPGMLKTLTHHLDQQTKP